MILSMRDLKFFLVFFLLLMLVDCSFGAMIPKNFEGEFTQITQASKKTKSNALKLRYESSKKLLVTYKKKDKSLSYSCDGSKSAWIRSKTELNYCYSNLFDILKNGLKTNKFYKVSSDKPNTYLLTFTKLAQKKVDFQLARIKFSKKPFTLDNIVSIQLKNTSKKRYLTLKRSRKLPVSKTFRKISSEAKMFKLPRAFEGEFIQIKKSLRGEKKSPVSIQYQNPKNIRMKVAGADQTVIYVCNKKKTWIYNPPFVEGEKGNVREGSSAKYCYSSLFDVLKFGLKSNKYYEVKQTKNTSFLLSFNDSTASKIGFQKVTVNFSKKPFTFSNVGSFLLWEKSGKKPLTLQTKKIKIVKNINENTFRFKIPPNTEIQQMN